MKTILFISGLLLSLWHSALWSADDQGQFAVRNAGMASCQDFVNEKKRNSPKLNLYMGWIDGYLSAANQFTQKTYDLIPWGNTVFLATLLENHCSKNPEQRFYVAVNKLAGSMMKLRLPKQSKMVKTEYQGKKTYVYQAVLEIIQQFLRKNGLYSGEADGKFGPGTRKALQDFQKKNGLAVTGLPDQITLYKIFSDIKRGQG